MSRVFLAEDLKLHMKVVIKIIDCDKDYLQDAVISEANVLRSIKHPNLVRIMDILKYGNSACLVMEYVEGKNLALIIKKDPGLAERHASQFFISLMHILETLHERKKPVIYRDMKPENIMVRPDLSICLIDFGTSKQFLTGGKDPVSTGTRKYAAPEQFKGVSDFRSDIYSLGKTMEKIAGKGSDRALKAVIKKATEADPVKRYSSVREMEKDFERRRKFKKRLTLAALLLLVFLTVVLSLYYGYSQKKERVLIADRYRKTVEEGNEAAYNGDLSLAEEMYTKAILEINGYEEEAYLKLLKLYRKAGAPSDGLERIDSYLDSHYGNTDRMDRLLFECGITAFHDLRDYKKAAVYFGMADSKNSPESSYLLSISEFLSSLKKDGGSYLKDLKEFRNHTESQSDIRKKTEEKLIYTDICLVLSEEEGVSDGVRNAVLLDGYSQGKKLLRLTEENTMEGEYELQALDMMSALCRLLGEKYPDKKADYFREAINYTDRADLLEDGEKRSERYVSIARMYKDLGDGKNACEFFKKAEKNGDSVSAYTEHMKYLESKSRYRELVKVYEDSLSINGIQANSEFQKIQKRMEKMDLLKG